MDTEYKGIVFRNFLIFGMCRILRVLNRMGQFRKVVFNFLNGFLSDMALYNKFGLSLVNILKSSAYRTQVISFNPLLRRDAYLLP